MSPPDRVATALADVRALGRWAPVRALYEGAKRAGAHELLLRPRRSPVPPLRSPLPPPAVEPTARVRERTLAAAEEIAAGRVRIFGTDVTFSSVPDWHAVIERPGHWPAVPWWEIDLRDDHRPGDFKWAWELGRHHHLVVLARACWLSPDDDRWPELLAAHLESWQAANPPELGIHWWSNLELALRAAAWLQVLTLAGDRLPEPLLRSMTATLWHTGHHLVVELPYTLSTMRNNHLVGDAVGLVLLGRAFGGRRARAWESLGRSLLVRHCAAELNPDGSTIEDALSYDRFVLELLSLARRVLSDDDTGASLAHWLDVGGRYLARLGVLDGPVPQFGDWDDGRALVVVDDDAGGRPLRGSTLLALALAGTGAEADGTDEHDELYWYAPVGIPHSPPQSWPGSGSRPGSVVTPPAGAGSGPAPGARPMRVSGGIARVESDPWRVWLRSTTVTQHGHADLTTVDLALGDHWVVGDPGTGTYNGDQVVRDALRSSAAHAALRVEGLDQLEPHRVFRWRHTGHGAVGEPLRVGDAAVLWGVHDAYRRLAPPRRVVRAVVVDDDGTQVTVADWVEPSSREGTAPRGGPARVRWSLSLPLAPEATWTPDADDRSGTVTLPDGTRVRLHLPAPALARRGSTDPFAGWWSDRYGRVVPSTVLRLDADLDAASGGPVVWHACLGDEAPRWHTEPGRIARERPDDAGGGAEVGVGWRGTVTLRVRQGERRWQTSDGIPSAPRHGGSLR